MRGEPEPRSSPFPEKTLVFFFHLQVRNRTARNSRPLEVIGTYDPIPKKDTYDNSGKLHKDIKLDTLRAKYWIGVGAQPTDVVWRLLSMVRSLPPIQSLIIQLGRDWKLT